MKCPQCEQENPADHKFCGQCATPLQRAAEAAPLLAPSYAEVQRSLTEALEQQTATSEILSVISRSPRDVQPVFETIAKAATTLCVAENSGVFVYDGTLIHFAAHDSWTVSDLEAVGRAFPRPPGSGTVTARAILTRAVAHTTVAASDAAYELVGFVGEGVRTILSVPMLRDGDPIGAISVTRRGPLLFTDRQIALLKTFADQGVIAIENVRLFKELETKNARLTEALNRETATAEILKVISGSPNDVQPVLDAVAESTARLCAANDVLIHRVEDGMMRLVAHFGTVPYLAESATRAISPRAHSGRAILESRVIHDHDMLDPRSQTDYPDVVDLGRLSGTRTVLAMPLLREGTPIGVIVIRRREVRPFSDDQIDLVKTFADQAVIALENVRLFNELDARNRDLTTALEQQTATGDILRVISGTQTDEQPVFDTIVRSAVRLCQATSAAVFRVAGGMVYEPANYGLAPERLAATRARSPRPLDMDTPPGVAILTRSVIQVADTDEPSMLLHVRDTGRLLGIRSLVAVPMVREGDAIGAIIVTRREPGAFPTSQVDLLKTFADQAVIAIENARLFRELQARTEALARSVEQLTALSDVGRAVSSSLDLETVLTTIVSRAVELSGLDGGVVFEYDEQDKEFLQRAQAETGSSLAATRRGTRIGEGQGVVGRTAMTLEPVQVSDITVPGAYVGPNRDSLIESGVRAILAVPMHREGHLIGCLAVTRNQPGNFPTETIELLRTFATQSALAIQNARLYQEIEEKSRQLETASQHKSEFLANMSHELRTPLNAVIGFSEVLRDRMFGELNEKQEEYLKDIHASGQHLLSLINDILDLSKIEAGRMELELSDFDLPATLDNALTLVRERAGRHGIALHMTVDEGVRQVRADERKVRQVLLNLLSNAIKFTPEGGRIDVRAASGNGVVEVSVSDTGVGIAPEDQEAIFEEFRQVGTAAKKVEGTGLGLALSRKFIELHGGRISVQSELSAGSTFTFTLPLRDGE